MIYDRWIRNWKSTLAENFFLRSITLLLGISLVITTLMLSVKSQRILLVPPQITKEFWIERDRVAPEYMEQIGVFIAMLVGNLSPGNAESNVNMLIEHYLDRSLKHPETVRELLGQGASYIKKNNITQAFFPSSIFVAATDNMKVRVEGSNVMNIGTARMSGERVSYLIRFNAREYKLYVEEFAIETRGKERDERAEENPETPE
jgi:conjugal transfer pilus assembly protein TraE